MSDLPSENLIGKIFGHLRILEFDGYEDKNPKWVGVCTRCRTKTSFLQKDLKKGKIKPCGKCKPKRKGRPKSKGSGRDSAEYKYWCKSVFKRDGHKCVCCGKRGWINSHHLNGWNWALRQRFDVNNGITLCAGPGSCHNKFHDEYGRGNNTKQQFVSYAWKNFKININQITQNRKKNG